MNKYNDDKYIVVDLETTGLDPFSGCEIIEIGITEIVNNKIVNRKKLFKACKTKGNNTFTYNKYN